MKIIINIKNVACIIFFSLVTLSCSSLKGLEQNNSYEKKLRQKININKDWYYLGYNAETVDLAVSNDKWQKIEIPHTWNAKDATDLTPGYRRDGSWYLKEIDVSKFDSNHVFQLYFEGVNITSEVYVNRKKVGEHIGGYIGFDVDITSALKKGTNEILVYVNNGYNPEVIPSQKSDFFIYGGITRDVWLKKLPVNHINDLKITTPEVTNDNAELNAKVFISNPENSKLYVEAALFNNEGNLVKKDVFDVIDNKANINFKLISNPILWDTKNPYLYNLTVNLKEEGKTVDEVNEKVGFRWFEFKDYGAFYLNGNRLKLRGTHRHEEHAGVGSAMSNKQHRADMELIKEMGANFVRLAHYPQDPEIYRACDELGLLVWDELPWCRGGIGNDNWKINTKNMLREIIEQNYNHPSIIIWSLGNEIYWLPDFEGGDDIDKLKDYLTELNNYAHELDPYRKTAIRKFYEGSDIVDVFFPSIWSGWYSGSYKSYQKAVDKYKKEYKHFLHTEYGGSSHVGRHTENPITGEGKIQADGWEEAIVQSDVPNIAKVGDWSENYIVDLFDWHLRISENDTAFVGNAQWAFKDFGTPLRPENPIPYVNQKGLVDRNNNPKDAFYVFKSYWNDTTPFAYIESHTWTNRQGPKGLKRSVSVYSNCSEIELFLNGKSLGVKKRNTNDFPAAGLNWNVDFVDGNNVLTAIAKTKDGDEIKDELNVNYRFTKNGKAKSLTLDYTKLENDNILVTATARDKEGLRALDFENRVYFQCLSGGETKKSMGTPTGSEAIEMANGKASIEVTRYSENIPLKIMVLSQDFKGTYLTID